MGDKKLRDSHIWAKEKHGHYVEPAWTSERLFAVESFGNDLIFDPSCGWGTILKSAEAAGYRTRGADIVDRKRHKLGNHFRRLDFLEQNWRFAKQFSIVCNPPFDHVEEFCRHALKFGARKVAMICLIRRLPAARWLQELPLKTIYLLTPRPSMPPGSYLRSGRKAGGGQQDFCWLVFDQHYKQAPRIKWLHRDG